MQAFLLHDDDLRTAQSLVVTDKAVWHVVIGPTLGAIAFVLSAIVCWPAGEIPKKSFQSNLFIFVSSVAHFAYSMLIPFCVGPSRSDNILLREQNRRQLLSYTSGHQCLFD